MGATTCSAKSYQRFLARLGAEPVSGGPEDDWLTNDLRDRYGIPRSLPREAARQMFVVLAAHPEGLGRRHERIKAERESKRRLKWSEARYVVAGFAVLVLAGLLAKASGNDGTGSVEIVVGIVVALALFIHSTNLD